MSRGPFPFVLPMLAEFLCQRIALGGAWALEMDGRGGAFVFNGLTMLTVNTFGGSLLA